MNKLVFFLLCMSSLVSAELVTIIQKNTLPNEPIELYIDLGRVIN